MHILKKYLKDEERRRVMRLDEVQKKPLSSYLNKIISVQHYHIPYKWNFYVHYLNEEKTKKIIFYPYNFHKD